MRTVRRVGKKWQMAKLAQNNEREKKNINKKTRMTRFAQNTKIKRQKNNY